MVNFSSPVVQLHRLTLNISRAPVHNVIELENIMLSLCVLFHLSSDVWLTGVFTPFYTFHH